MGQADEYAKPAGNEYAMLLVRCLGGRVRYCDELEPDAEDLTQGCIEARLGSTSIPRMPEMAVGEKKVPKMEPWYIKGNMD